MVKYKKTLIKNKTLKSLETLAFHTIDCENDEYDSYVTYCEELEINPANIRGKLQSKHIYALALIGLGMVFPKD